MHGFIWPIAAIPRVVVAGRFPLADRGFATRYRGPTHAIHLHDYAARMRIGDGEAAIAPGDVTLSPAGAASAYDLAAPGRHWCVHFADDAGPSERISLPPVIRAARAGAARETLAQVTALHARAGESRVAATAAGLALQGLLLSLAENDTPRDDAAARAAAVIDARFAEPLDVAAIAAAAGCSVAHLARVFRARFGSTIPHRLISRRVEHARYLLEVTDLPIWRVAERVGIPDAQHFNKTVRRLTGRSPSAIRAASRAVAVDPDR